VKESWFIATFWLAIHSYIHSSLSISFLQESVSHKRIFISLFQPLSSDFVANILDFCGCKGLILLFLKSSLKPSKEFPKKYVDHWPRTKVCIDKYSEYFDLWILCKGYPVWLFSHFLKLRSYRCSYLSKYWAMHHEDDLKKLFVYGQDHLIALDSLIFV